MTEVLITRLPHGEGLPLPSLATPGAAGYDVASADDGPLGPLERKLFRTGFAIAVPVWLIKRQPDLGTSVLIAVGVALGQWVPLPLT